FRRPSRSPAFIAALAPSNRSMHSVNAERATATRNGPTPAAYAIPRFCGTGLRSLCKGNRRYSATTPVSVLGGSLTHCHAIDDIHPWAAAARPETAAVNAITGFPVAPYPVADVFAHHQFELELASIASCAHLSLAFLISSRHSCWSNTSASDSSKTTSGASN